MFDSISSKELEVLQKKYPAHVFVLVKPAVRSDIPLIDKQKYIVQKSTTVGMFLSILRKRLHLPAEKALFLFVGNNLPTTSATLAELFALHGKQGYLEITYAGENTFGKS